NPARDGGAVTLAFCWAHLRRRFYEVYVGGHAPIATEALARIKLLYDIEAEIRGLPPEVRQAVRQEKSKPVIEEMKLWFEASLAKVSMGGRIAKAIRYGLNHYAEYRTMPSVSDGDLIFRPHWRRAIRHS